MKKLIVQIYSFIQSLTGFNKLGKGSVIKYPAKIWNRDCIEIGDNVFIGGGCFIGLTKYNHGNTYQPLLKIGSNVCIGRNLFISGIGKITIEDNVLFSDRVFISDHIHDYSNISMPIIEQQLVPRGDVLIKEGAFIGINAVIMPGVTIGKNSVVGASSVVIKDIPDYSVATGNPAMVIKYFDVGKKEWVKAQ